MQNGTHHFILSKVKPQSDDFTPLENYIGTFHKEFAYMQAALKVDKSAKQEQVREAEENTAT